MNKTATLSIKTGSAPVRCWAWDLRQRKISNADPVFGTESGSYHISIKIHCGNVPVDRKELMACS